MKTRRFAYLRRAALAGCVGGIVSVGAPAHAAESPLAKGISQAIGILEGAALQRASVQTTAYGARQMAGSPGYNFRIPAGAPAYARPFRGYILPRVWLTPNYVVTNWQGYNLPRPAQGFGWSRYYDDAVLTDSNGRVFDTVQGVNWAAGPAAPGTVQQTYSPDYDPYNYDEDLLLGNDDVVHGTHWQQSYDDAAPGVSYDNGYYDNRAPVAPPVASYDPGYDAAFLEACRRDNGLGGAAIGAGVGGLAGNRIAGRGNRTGGTLIGAGVGAVAGMVIDKAEDRQRCKQLLARETQGGAYGTSYAPPPPPPPPYNNGEYYAQSAPPPPAYAGDYDPRFLEACRRDNGLGGAVIGAGVGGLAGNRIAGRGNRTGGTLIGAGVGAIAGMVIDKAEDRERCKRLLAQQGTGYPQYGAGYPPPAGQPGGYPPPPPGYYYYYPPPTVTTVTITPGHCNCTEETVTTVVRPVHHARTVHRSKNVRVYRK